MEIDYKKISNVVVEGIDHSDYPDFCDAYIASADYDGRPMSDEMLEELNCECPDFVHEAVWDWLY